MAQRIQNTFTRIATLSVVTICMLGSGLFPSAKAGAAYQKYHQKLGKSVFSKYTKTGYADKRLGNNKFFVSGLSDKEDVSLDRTHAIAMLRASEIAIANGYTYFKIVEEKNTYSEKYHTEMVYFDDFHPLGFYPEYTWNYLPWDYRHDLGYDYFRRDYGSSHRLYKKRKAKKYERKRRRRAFENDHYHDRSNKRARGSNKRKYDYDDGRRNRKDGKNRHKKHDDKKHYERKNHERKDIKKRNHERKDTKVNNSNRKHYNRNKARSYDYKQKERKNYKQQKPQKLNKRHDRGNTHDRKNYNDASVAPAFRNDQAQWSNAEFVGSRKADKYAVYSEDFGWLTANDDANSSLYHLASHKRKHWRGRHGYRGARHVYRTRYNRLPYYYGVRRAPAYTTVTTSKSVPRSELTIKLLHDPHPEDEDVVNALDAAEYFSDALDITIIDFDNRRGGFAILQ